MHHAYHNLVSYVFILFSILLPYVSVEMLYKVTANMSYKVHKLWIQPYSQLWSLCSDYRASDATNNGYSKKDLKM